MKGIEIVEQCRLLGLEEIVDSEGHLVFFASIREVKDYGLFDLFGRDRVKILSVISQTHVISTGVYPARDWQ